MAIVCVVGEGLQRDPRARRPGAAGVGDVPIRLVSQAGVPPQRDLRDSRVRSRPRAGPAARAVLRAGTGTRGPGMMRAAPRRPRADGQARREPCARVTASIVAGVVSEAEAERRLREATSAMSTSRSTSRSAMRYRTTCRCWPRAGSTSSIGTTGWSAHERGLRDLVAKPRIGVLAASNFSLGMNLFQLSCEDAAHRVRARTRRSAPGSTSCITPQEGCALGHRAAAEGRHGARRLRRGPSICPRRVPDRSPARTLSASTDPRTRSR